MNRKVFSINGERFDDFQGFVREFQRNYVRHVGGDWRGGLDAFNDYLTWADSEYTLIWENSHKSKFDLGYYAMALWLEGILDTCHPIDRPKTRKRLRLANAKTGETLFGQIVEIINSNSPFVRLQLE